MKNATEYDVIVVGSGAAGCSAALSLAPLRVALVTAGQLGADCSSLRTQGGVAAAIGQGDSPQKHMRDTMIAGADIVDTHVVRDYTKTACGVASYLELNGVQFDCDDAGYILSREGGHSENRVLKAKSGDSFGREMMPALWHKIKNAGHIDIIDGANVCEILKSESGAARGVVYNQKNRRNTRLLTAGAVILATGGAAGLYDKTTNPRSNTGSAISLAYQAGADLADLEFMQFHPTALDCGADHGSLPLLTEALRGHGATLVNDHGARFMTDIHPLAELAPRDIVARAIAHELNQGHRVYLDCRNIDTSGFETLQQNAKTYGFDPAHDLIPVVPAAHYHMGGVLTDKNGKTTLDGLWVIGEAASTGFHGANRLASNSILEAVTMGRKSAENIKGEWTQLRNHTKFMIMPHVHQKRTDYVADELKGKIIKAMRRAMSENVGIIRTERDMYDAQCFFEEILAEYRGLDLDIENMATVCRLITRAARARTESRGGHYRADFPYDDRAWKHRTILKADHTKQQIWQELRA